MKLKLLFISCFFMTKLLSADYGDLEKSNQLFHFGMGPVWFNNFGVETTGYGFQAGRDFEVDFGHAFIDAQLALHEKGAASFGSHIGLNYYENLTDTINFFGGGKGELAI